MKNSNKKGIAPIFLVIGVVAVLGIVGFILTRSKGGTGMKLGNNLINSSSCKFKDPDVCRYIAKGQAMEATMKGGVVMKSISNINGKKTESYVEMANNNSRFYTIENGKIISEMIMYDGTTYMKDMTDNKWWKYPKAEDNNQGNQTEEFKKNLKTDFSDIEDNTLFTKIGKERCGQLNCFKYEMKVSVETVNMTQYIYFDDKEYLLRKMVMDTNGQKTETEFDYKTVTINIPSPVKDMPGAGDFTNFLNDAKSDQPDTAATNENSDDSMTQDQINDLINQAQGTLDQMEE